MTRIRAETSDDARSLKPILNTSSIVKPSPINSSSSFAKRRPTPLRSTVEPYSEPLDCQTARINPLTAVPTSKYRDSQSLASPPHNSSPPARSRFSMPNEEEPSSRTRSPLAEGSGISAAHSSNSIPSNSINSNLVTISNSSNPPSLLSRPILPAAVLRSPSYSSTLPSPCFVHSHLDSSVTENVKREEDAKKKKERRERKAKTDGETLTSTVEEESESEGSTTTTSGSEEDDSKNSLTRQLAETAVSVREMSKQLGRARVKSHVQSIMIITKARDNHLIRLTRELALWLMQTPRNGRDRGVTVYVDTQLKKSKRFDAEGMEKEFPELFRPAPRRYSRTSSSTSVGSDTGINGKRTMPAGLQPLQDLAKKVSDSKPPSAERRTNGEEGQLRYWTNEMCTKSPHLFDYVVTLGGDGTVLYASWLFQHVVPPVIPFALGSLGFLTNFDFAHYCGVLDNAIDNGIRVNLRMRFSCTVFRAIEGETNQRRAVRSGKTGGIFMNSLGKSGWESIESSDNNKQQGRQGGRNGKDKEIKCFMTKAVETFEVLNDLVVDRGPSPYVSLLELFGDEHHMTTVQADGLTVSTPTGSTAYSLSAGGSLVHPEIPALLITPICPHTLSFRPMLLPDSMELRICVPYNSRSTAWASFDGRGRVELKQGDHIKVTASAYPFPTVCADKQSTDWFHSISRTLRWNERKKQSSFVILEQGHKKSRTNTEEDTDQINPPNHLANSVHSVHLEEEAGSNSSSAEDEDDEDDDGEEEGYDIDDLSSESTPNTNPTSPIIAPTDPSRNRIPTLSRPPSNDSDLTTMAKIQDERDRFLSNPLPKPRRLSARHTQSPIIIAPTDSSASTSRSPNPNPSPILSASTTRRRERGEEGDRDFINESLAFKRNVGATASGKRRSGIPNSPKSSEITPTPSKNLSTAEEMRTCGQGDGEKGDYAFAIFGCDFSDASNSEAE